MSTRIPSSFHGGSRRSVARSGSAAAGTGCRCPSPLLSLRCSTAGSAMSPRRTDLDAAAEGEVRCHRPAPRRAELLHDEADDACEHQLDALRRGDRRGRAAAGRSSSRRRAGSRSAAFRSACDLERSGTRCADVGVDVSRTEMSTSACHEWSGSSRKVVSRRPPLIALMAMSARATSSVPAASWHRGSGRLQHQSSPTPIVPPARPRRSTSCHVEARLELSTGR